jgi:hypothetical protein
MRCASDALSCLVGLPGKLVMVRVTLKAEHGGVGEDVPGRPAVARPHTLIPASHEGRKKVGQIVIEPCPLAGTTLRHDLLPVFARHARNATYIREPLVGLVEV